MGCGNSKPPQETENSLKIKTKNEEDPKKSKILNAKVVLLGEQAVGKSSIAQRYVKNIFTGTHVTTIGGAYLQQKVVLNNGVCIKLHIWDTGGQERFRAMANLYYRDANAAILTYDITNEESFKGLEYWINELKFKVDNDGMVLCLAGNKCDVSPSERKVDYNKAKRFADENKMLFFETSAKMDIGLKDLFNSLCYKLYEKKVADEPK